VTDSRIPKNFRPSTPSSLEPFNLERDYLTFIAKKDYWINIMGEEAYSAQCNAFKKALNEKQIRIRKRSDDEPYIDKVKGMLLGHLSGEALGVPLESQGSDPSFSHKAVVGGHNWCPGESTEDGDLMICVLKALQNIENFNLTELRESIIEWYVKKPKDVGITNRESIERMINSKTWFGGDNAPKDKQDNGSLMRVAPIAILECREEAINHYIEDQARLTHGSEVCINADRIFIKALKAALTGANQKELFDLIHQAAIKIEPSIASSFRLGSTKHWKNLNASGWVLHTYEVLGWSLNNCASYEEAVIQAVHIGDDACTNGAIVGATFGALYGLQSIPKQWLNSLERYNDIENEIKRIFFRE
jgi:ADP-ribosyl-[dinitrogen reductase] hydrolase